MKKCLLALALLFAVLLSGCAIVQTTDLADYGNTGGETWHGSAVFDLLSNLTSTGDADGTQSAAPPRMQELFPIFPPDALLQRAQDRDYHHLYRYTLLQDELFTRLSCRYSAADYQAEVDRLAALGATYDTTLFRLPAYIWMLHDTDNSEYVLLADDPLHCLPDGRAGCPCHARGLVSRRVAPGRPHRAARGKGECIMTCPQCGTENAADARLCRHCGATLPEGPQPVPLRLQHVAASRLCLLTAAVSTAGLVLFLLLTLLFPAMQQGFHELAASVGVLLPKDGRLFGGAAFFFFLPSAALCAGLWLAWRAARKEEPVPLTAYRAFRAAAWMEFVLLTVLCLPLHLYLFPFHLPDFARSRVLSGYIGLLVIWAISLVYFCVSRRFLRALGWRALREKQGTGPCCVMLGINVLLALAMVLGAFSGLFSESLFSGFFPLAFFDGLCRGGGRLLAVLSLLVWAAIRVLLALLLLRLWPLLQKPEK